MKIDIAGLEWEIAFADAHSPELLVDGSPRRGATWCGHQKIFISNELSTACAPKVIRHELVHAYIWSTQINLLESFDEEYVCDFLAIYGPQILEASEQIFKTLYFVREGHSIK